jgi:hypothetical protein
VSGSLVFFFNQTMAVAALRATRRAQCGGPCMRALLAAHAAAASRRA